MATSSPLPRRCRLLLCLAAGWMSAGSAQAGFLFEGQGDMNFIVPTFNFGTGEYEYSAWNDFYAPHTMGNFPDVFAPFGGEEISPGLWAPVTRLQAGFPAHPVYVPGGSNPQSPGPLAFWHANNPTITQSATSANITGSLNIYTFAEATAYKLEDTTSYNLGTVMFQFQTDGSLVDLSQLRLEYFDGTGYQTLNALESGEYLREYNVSGGGHPSAAAGYRNRVAVQWDLSEITDVFGAPIKSYTIKWESLSSSMSFQQAALDTSDTYQAGLPISATWIGGSGGWNQAANWSLKSNSGLVLPIANGNIRFQNFEPATVSLNGSHVVGELIFESEHGVTITAPTGQTLTANTGVTTRPGASGTYHVESDFVLGALNFFEIASGTVSMDGTISGPYGLVKLGIGTLVLAGQNTFTDFLAVQNGTVRVEGTNAYSGGTSVTNGSLVVAGNAGSSGALGNSTSTIAIGADEELYQYSSGNETLRAELWIDGDHQINRSIVLAPGNHQKRLGALNAGTGAGFGGAINLTSNPALPNSTASASGNVFLTASAATDRLSFTGAITGGAPSREIIIDGLGTVVFSGANKTYQNSTRIKKGTLEIATGTALQTDAHVIVESGAKLTVHGSLTGTGVLQIDQGTISGDGLIGRPFTVDAGDLLSPGGSPGSLETVNQTWASGGALRLELQHATALGGWDTVQITGTLTLTATQASPFALRISSITAAGIGGLLEGFQDQQSFTWTFLHASAGIQGFNPAAFSFDTSAFAHAFTGQFSIQQSDGDLILAYTAVPEPTHGLLLASGASALLSLRRRRAAR